MKTVANQFGDDRVLRQHRSGEPRRAVRDRGHPVEQVCRMARTGIDGGDGPFEIRAGVSKGYPLSRRARAPG